MKRYDVYTSDDTLVCNTGEWSTAEAVLRYVLKQDPDAYIIDYETMEWGVATVPGSHFWLEWVDQDSFEASRYGAYYEQ